MTPYHHLTAGAVPNDAALIWPWAVDWSTPPSEALEWLTSLQESQGSKEQRRALRFEPRLILSYSHLLQGDHIAAAQMLLRAWKARPWAVPAWAAKSKLTQPAGSGSNSLMLSRATDTLWYPGSLGMVWANAESVETFTVDTVSGSSIAITGALATSWPKGATVVPLHIGDLPDSQAATAVVGEVLRIDISFSIRPGFSPTLPEPADGSAWGTVYPTGANPSDPRTHLLGLVHNWKDGATLSIEQSVQWQDPGTGLKSSRISSDYSKLAWSVKMLLQGDSAISQLRKFLAVRRGRAVGFYALAPTLDVESLDMISGVVSSTSLKLFADPTKSFVGVSYIDTSYEPSNVTFRMMGGVVADETGNYALTATGTVESIGGKIVFGAGSYLTISPPLQMPDRFQPWHLLFKSDATGVANLSTEDDGGSIRTITIGSPSIDPKVIAVINNRGTGHAGLTSGSYSPNALMRLTNTGSGAVKIFNGPAEVASVSSSETLDVDQLGAWAHDSTVDYALQAGLWNVVAGTGPLVPVGYERVAVPATFTGSDFTVSAGGTKSLKFPRLVSPVRLASDRIEITHHSLGIAEVTLPIVTYIP